MARMAIQDLTTALSALFILVMIWLRTRIQYSQRGRRLQLQRAGKIYFVAALALLTLGWLVAPSVGAAFWPRSAASPVLTRVVWFMAAYYVFILVHRYLRLRKVEVFKPVELFTSQ
jgi:hypothetical protein